MIGFCKCIYVYILYTEFSGFFPSYTKKYVYKCRSVLSALKKNKEEVEVCVVITENFKRGMNNKYYIFTSKIQNIQEVCKSRMLKSES